MNDFLSHYGTPRHSGRYPWGSGDNPYQRTKSFLSYVDDLKKSGLTEVEIAKGLGMTTTQLRAKRSIAVAEKRSADQAMATRLKEKGYSNVKIAERMGINESVVRSLLNPVLKERAKITSNIAGLIKENVDSKKYLDVGSGTEAYLGVSKTKLNTAVSMLENEGYKVQYVKVKQVGTGKYTSIKVLTKEDVPWTELNNNKDKIENVSGYTEDGGRTILGLESPSIVNSSRVYVRYGDKGGSDKDGIIELRRNVEDLDLGSSRYAQVRISVDGTHYLKGMALYSDDIPNGYDIVFNTNKKTGTPIKSDDPNASQVFKSYKSDPDNPFGATVRQKHYIGKDGKDHLSALNIVNEEGDWDSWSKTISSQMLSKQSPSVAKKQLDLAYQAKKEEYDSIMQVTNSALRKKLLESFADDCDSSSVHLKGAAFPRQSSHVILSFPEMKENEVYAPNYNNGERVVLIRYPHGGIFEIPELTVNNKYKNPQNSIGKAKDAIGIHPNVAKRLSGADFDGDTVLVIPNKDKMIRTSSPLKELENFDPQTAYPGYEGMKVMSSKLKQTEMGKISNLITDMTIRGASDEDLAAAVRHSMVVIDAEKHKLNYKQSYIDNGIAALKEKYQGSEKAGASTLISRASSEIRVPDREEITPDPVTGERRYRYTGATYVDEKGRTRQREIVSTRMAETDDAYKLSSGTRIESLYADHANKLKALANRARKDMLETPNQRYSPSAKQTYQEEVDSLKSKLRIAEMNSPLERKAQLIANKIIKMKLDDNPNMENDRLKKLKGQAITEARRRVGAKKNLIDITDKEWEAIQAGAVSQNTLTKIFNNSNLDSLKQRSMPRRETTMTQAKIARARLMLENGLTQAEVAEALGVSATTIKNALS